MKINGLHIAAFGGLKNVDLSFKEGFNVVYGDNENGKTTIMSFIKMMFYGTERGSAQISKNLRKKYTPWDNSAMAGSIDFENNNRNYRLERSFGSSNSTDRVTLIDLDLGTRESVSADIGLKLFGLSGSAFERSIFIGQFGFPESNSAAEGEINSKLSNLTSTGDQEISFDEVNTRLQNAKYALMSKSGRAGIYDKNVISAKALAEKIEKSNQTQQEILLKKQLAEKIHSAITVLQSKAQQLKTKIDSEQDFRNAEKLKELLSLKEKLDALNATLKLENGDVADEMFVRKVEFCLSKIEKIENKIQTKQNENSLLENNLRLALNPSENATPEERDRITRKIENLKEQIAGIGNNIKQLEAVADKKLHPIWSVLIYVFAIASVGLFFLKPIYYIISLSLLLAVVAIVVTFKVVNKAKKKKREEQILRLKLNETNLISELSQEKSSLSAINAALNTNSAMIENQKQKISENKEEIENLNTEKANESGILYSLFSAFAKVNSTEQVKNSLLEIKEKAAIQKEIKQNINYILKDIGNISYEEAKAKLEAINSPLENETDFDEIKSSYDDIINNITDQKTELATLLTEIKSLSAALGNTEADKKQLEELRVKIIAQKEYCDALDIALSVLADSFVEVRRSFGSVLEKKASDIFKGITGGKYSSMSISKSFEIAVEKTNEFGSKEIDYLSSGTADQAYLSLRLAVCELMSQNDERLPVLLDDALAQYDDSRTKTALEFLKEYSLDGQTIMFTCHNSVLEASKQTGANEIIL